MATTVDAPLPWAPPDASDTFAEAIRALNTYKQRDASKVIVRFKAVGNAPIMKQNFYKITSSNRFQAVIQFLRKELGWQAGDPLFTYVNLAFSPAPDDTVSNLFKSFSTDGHLIVNYRSCQPASVNSIGFGFSIANQTIMNVKCQKHSSAPPIAGGVEQVAQLIGVNNVADNVLQNIDVNNVGVTIVDIGKRTPPEGLEDLDGFSPDILEYLCIKLRRRDEQLHSLPSLPASMPNSRPSTDNSLVHSILALVLQVVSCTSVTIVTPLISAVGSVLAQILVVVVVNLKVGIFSAIVPLVASTLYNALTAIGLNVVVAALKKGTK
ncbi:hypothetical protein C0991_006940 [Blastosporella zonata]|nr:hypothetical protein C0991_006940 [Blastosporella zonata]